MSEHFKTPWHVDPLSATVYASDVPKGPARVADMRGWGYLTGKGHGALALSQDEAIDIQRANAAFIVEAVNRHDALLRRVAALELIIAEEVNPFNCRDDLNRMLVEEICNRLDPVGGASRQGERS